MEEKLEILKGEAVEFIDVILELQNDFNKDLDNYLKNSIKITKLIDFYSQPFSMKMIEEYFDGWSKSSLNFWLHYSSSSIFMVNSDWLNYNGITCLSPKTLSHFITLCKLTNIKLIWKE